jgi:hypothetical protein
MIKITRIPECTGDAIGITATLKLKSTGIPTYIPLSTEE